MLVKEAPDVYIIHLEGFDNFLENWRAEISPLSLHTNSQLSARSYLSIYSIRHLGPLLLSWITFNPIMDKQLRPL